MGRGRKRLAGRVALGIGVSTALGVGLFAVGAPALYAVLTAWLASALIIPATVFVLSPRECRVDCPAARAAAERKASSTRSAPVAAFKTSTPAE